MPIILDGGLSTALTEQGYDLSHELWTARLIAEEPAALVRAHRAFLDAGAEVLYATVRLPTKRERCCRAPPTSPAKPSVTVRLSSRHR
jgi:Homocysteine S-methyltransferase